MNQIRSSRALMIQRSEIALANGLAMVSTVAAMNCLPGFGHSIIRLCIGINSGCYFLLGIASSLCLGADFFARLLPMSPDDTKLAREFQPEALRNIQE